MAEATIKPVVIIGHSKILFWWPVWLYGFFMCFWTFFFTDGTVQNYGTLHNTLSLGFIMLVLLVVTFTNMKLPPTLFIIFMLSIVLLIIIIKLDSSIKILPLLFGNARVSMNFWFYLTFSTGLFIIWLLSVYLYDPSVTWMVKRGQIIIRRVYSHTDDETLNVANAVFVRKFDDFVCHWVLGLGLVGDLYMRADGRTEVMQNVIFARRKTQEIKKTFR